MELPFEPVLFGYKINIHLIAEYLAFFVGFRYYLSLRKRISDPISSHNRLSIIIGAVFGAFIGSRLIGFLEDPFYPETISEVLHLLQYKTIMGGLFGGLLGVELVKKMIKEKTSSGDLFVYPIILGIIIGRFGCFLSGMNEFTYGKPTNFILGMNLGDGLYRHPIALYEIFFLCWLWIVLKCFQRKFILENGLLFKVFMIAYFGFRFSIEFLKPNVFLTLGLSSIQYLCILCFLYYRKTLSRLFYRPKRILRQHH